MQKVFALSLRKDGTVIYNGGDTPHVFKRPAKAYRYLAVVGARKYAGDQGKLTGAYTIE